MKRFLRRALFQGAVPEEADCDAAILLRLRRIGGAGGKRNNAGDNARAMKKSQGWRHRMEGAALSLVQTVGAPENLGQEFLWLDAASEQMAVISMRREQIIIAAQARDRGDTRGFLADVKMIMSAEYSLIMKRHKAFFEMTY